MEVLQGLSPVPLVFVCIMVVLDIVTGLIKAVSTKSYSSEKMRDGLWHKSGIIATIMLAYVLQVATGMLDFSALGFEPDFTVPLTTVAAVYIVVMETGSIIESIGVINPELQDNWFMRLFDWTKGKGDGR